MATYRECFNVYDTLLREICSPSQSDTWKHILRCRLMVLDAQWYDVDADDFDVQPLRRCYGFNAAHEDAVLFAAWDTKREAVKHVFVSSHADDAVQFCAIVRGEHVVDHPK